MTELHIGCTATRHGMSPAQIVTATRLIEDLLTERMILVGERFVAHHGCCVGGDSDFHEILRRSFDAYAHIVGHPGPDWPDGPLCARVECDEVIPPAQYMVRNRAIVASSQVMIAAPLERWPAARGGTRATVSMAIQALRTGKLRATHIVGRDGRLLDHADWV